MLVSYRNYGCPSACSYFDPYTCHFGSAFRSGTIHQQSVNHANLFFPGTPGPPCCHLFQGAGPCQYKEILTYIPGMGGMGPWAPGMSPQAVLNQRWDVNGGPSRRSAVGRPECIGWYLYLERRKKWRFKTTLVESNLQCSWLRQIDAVYVYVHVCMHRCMCKGSIMILGSFVQVSKHASWHIQFLAYEWFKQKVRY